MLHRLSLHPEVFPCIAVIAGLNGNRFAAVHDRTAADRYDQSHIILPGKTGTFLHLGQRRIGHDPGELYDPSTVSFPDGTVPHRCKHIKHIVI